MNFVWVFGTFRTQGREGFFVCSTRLRRNAHFGYVGVFFFLVLLKISLEICVLAPSIFDECLGPFGHFYESDGLDLCFRRRNKVNIKVTIWAEAVSYRILQCF